MNILFKNGKKVIANRPCGCSGKGPHKADCVENSGTQANPIQQEAKATSFNPAGSETTSTSTATSNRFNASAEAESITSTDTKLTDQQVLDLFLTASETDAGLLTPYEYEEGKYRYMPLYWSPSGATKDGKTNFFNCMNPHKLAENGAVYVTRNGGLGIHSKFWGNQQPPEGTVILTPIIIANISDLV